MPHLLPPGDSGTHPPSFTLKSSLTDVLKSFNLNRLASASTSSLQGVGGGQQPMWVSQQKLVS